MNESEFQIEKIRLLLDAYLRIVESWSKCPPCDQAGLTWKAADWIKVQLREALK